MSDEIEFYKPHIRARIFADVPSREASNFYKPIDINKYPDTLELSCTVKRDCLQGNFALTLLLDVVNLSTYIKWQLLNRKYKYIVVYSGYLGTEYYDKDEYTRDNYIDSKLNIIFKGSILWMGTVVEARKKVVTRFVGVQNTAEALSVNTETMTLRYDAGYNLYQLIDNIIRVSNNPNVKLNLSEEDYNTVIQAPVLYYPYNRRSLDAILDLYGITITEELDLVGDAIDEQSYIEMNSEKRKPIEEGPDKNVVLVTEDTGLIDIPTLQSSGEAPTVRFKMLFDPRVKTFNYVKLRNADIQLPQIDEPTQVDYFNTGMYLNNGAEGYGYYLVLTITYSLDSRGGNFYQEIEASPYNIYNIAIGERLGLTIS